MTIPVNEESAEPRADAGASEAGQAGNPPGRMALDPERWVDEYGDYLLRYALSRLRDPVLAEDFVQETFLAALKGRKSFQGRSAEKSWLAGILKHKILDHFRRAGRETTFTDMEFLSDEMSHCFEPEGKYKDCWIHERGPSEWHAMGASLDQEAFWAVFRHCAGKLPKNIARVFVLREVDDLPSDEICAALGISPNNLWVMLHRARMALRKCLEINWFEKQEAG